MSDSNVLAKIIKQRRVMIPLTLRELATKSGVSASHLGRIERGERFASAFVLRKLVAPLGYTETELFKLAGFLSRDDSDLRIERIKKELKRDIAHALVTLYRRVDSA